MTLLLTPRERADLRAKAHVLEPVIQVGQAGLSDALVAEVDRALLAHELIKVKLGSADREIRASLTQELCSRTGAAEVQQLGKVVVLWRPRSKDDQ